MRIIFLNIWEGKLWKVLSHFISENSVNTDIFCFQEVPISLTRKIQNVLPGFDSVFYHKENNLLKDNGQSVFVKKPIEIKTSESILFPVKDKAKDEVGFLQKVTVTSSKGDFIIGNLQGRAYPGDKLDSDLRLAQSETIINSFKKEDEPKIIGGDFNLDPNTRSIKIIEKAKFRNLIREFGVESTRNHFAWQQAKRQKKQNGWKFFGKQHFADYVFVSKDVKVNKFEVPQNEISDHLPLVLDFEV